MGHFTCCVVNCINTGRNSKCKFYSFPKARNKFNQKSKWINAVRRINSDGSHWHPRPFDRICSDHFIGNKKGNTPNSPNYIPTIFPPIYKVKETDGVASMKRFERFMALRNKRERAIAPINKKEVPATIEAIMANEFVVEDIEVDNVTRSTLAHSDKKCQVETFLTTPVTSNTFICNRYNCEKNYIDVEIQTDVMISSRIIIPHSSQLKGKGCNTENKTFVDKGVMSALDIDMNIKISICFVVRKYLSPKKVSRLDLYDVIDEHFAFDYLINVNANLMVSGKDVDAICPINETEEMNNDCLRKQNSAKVNRKLCTNFRQSKTTLPYAVDNVNIPNHRADDCFYKARKETSIDGQIEFELDKQLTNNLEKSKKGEIESTTNVAVYQNEIEEPELVRAITNKENINISKFESLQKLTQVQKHEESVLIMELDDSPVVNRGNLPQRRKSLENQVNILMIYPPPPVKNGIAISSNDYMCLRENEFLNDIIIDFYLKYLFHEVLSLADRERSHIFSSHFFTRLTNPQSADSELISQTKERHAGVRRWTKNVNIFKKDFIIIPVNEDHHWFLAIICFPNLVGFNGLDTSRCCSNGDELQKPCILVFDSLFGTNKARMATILRGYLYYEYFAKMKEYKSFSSDEMTLIHPQVPKQKNATDCGLYLLQYVENFFKNPIKNFSTPFKNMKNWFSDDVVQNKRQNIANLIADLSKNFHKDVHICLPDLTLATENKTNLCSITQKEPWFSLENKELLYDTWSSSSPAQLIASNRNILEVDNNQTNSMQNGELLFDVDFSPTFSKYDSSNQFFKLRKINQTCFDTNVKSISNTKSPSPRFIPNNSRQYSRKYKNCLNSTKKSLCELDVIRSGPLKKKKLQYPEASQSQHQVINNRARSNARKTVDLANSFMKKERKSNSLRTSDENPNMISIDNANNIFVPNTSPDPFYNLSFEALQRDSKISPSMSYLSFLKFKKKKLESAE